MSIPVQNTPDITPSAFKEIKERESGMLAHAGSAGTRPFDAVLKSAITSGTALDREKICMIMLRMNMQMHEKLFSVMSEEKRDRDIYSSFFGLMNKNVRGMLPVPLASKIQHSCQNNDETPTQPKGHINEIIDHAADRFNVDPDLIRGVIKAESNFNSHSTSPKGAKGLMQLMPATARDLGVKDPYDPYENVMGGTRYLKGLLDRYGGDIDRALAAYNWGMGNVEKYPGRLPRETRTYISRIKEYYLETKA